MTAGEPATVEAWCLGLIAARTVADKLTPPARSRRADPATAPAPATVAALEPGRPPGLRVQQRAERIPRPGALREASARARLLHLFLHHEVQAAELFAWAFLRWPDAPAPFRSGLLGLADDELRHARLYRDQLVRLGHAYGSFPVRDWFWSKARACDTPRQFVALMGLGFEGANLEHAERFASQLEAAGDGESAAVVRRVGDEEVAHVRFGARWFARFDGGDPARGPDFQRWAAALPPPLTPSLLRGTPLHEERRRRAGLSEGFLRDLEAAGSRTTAPSPRAPRP